MAVQSNAGERTRASDEVRARRLVLFAQTRIFTADECNSIIALGQAQTLKVGTVRAGDVHKSERDNAISWLDHGETTSWIYDRIFSAVDELNRQSWGFRLAGSERLQFSEYRTEGHYTWHVDIGVDYPMTMRKVTATIQLSDPDDYDGGAFEAQFSAEPSFAPREQGTMAAFPSFVLHRVHPVIRGTRYSLTGWVLGDAPFV